MYLEPFRVLAQDEIGRIHAASAHILSNVGVKILGAKLFELLRGSGCQVDATTGVVRFPSQMIEDALSGIPKRFSVFDRTGKHAFVLGDGTPRIAAGHNAVNWLDGDTAETRYSTVADVERFAGICHHLEAIDMIGIPAMPQDVPNPRATLLHGVRAVVESSTKPVFFSTESPAVNNLAIRLLRAASGGDMGSRPYGIAQLSPTSPLYWEEGVCEALRDTVEQDVPLAILPEPNAGVSAPYTLAGLLTMNNAECLSGMIISQLLKPGSKILYANSWTTTDMRTGAALVGSTETSICRIAGAQLAKHYGVPCHTTAPNSDDHAHDEQNAWEKTFSTFCAVGARNDLIVNCGMFATGMTCSNEQLLMDEMISAASLRIMRGVAVNEETIARELIERIGPMGETYLTQEHTLDHLGTPEFLAPRLTVTGSLALWKERGAKDTYRLAREAVEDYANRPIPPLAEERRKAMQEIIASFCG